MADTSRIFTETLIKRVGSFLSDESKEKLVKQINDALKETGINDFEVVIQKNGNLKQLSLVDLVGVLESKDTK